MTTYGYTKKIDNLAMEREKIARDTEEFLAKGNEILYVPTGLSGIGVKLTPQNIKALGEVGNKRRAGVK